jgi:hypothetical protein
VTDRRILLEAPLPRDFQGLLTAGRLVCSVRLLDRRSLGEGG